jgi:putative transposase
LTHVTVNRSPLLVTHVDLLWEAIIMHRARTPFDLIAWVILPDHMHLLVCAGEHDLSRLMRRIKLTFSARLRVRLRLAEGRVWQYRFWDRVMRDPEDIKRHIDYIHYNPVKHGYVSDPFRWEHSSLSEYFRSGYYQRDWGADEQVSISGEYGE